MDVESLIARFGTTYTVTRRAKAIRVAGRAQPGPTSTLQVVASVVPATGRELERLPEGRRAIETRALLTITPLLVGGQDAANEADLILVDGKLWEVQNVESWPAAVADRTFFRALIQVSQ